MCDSSPRAETSVQSNLSAARTARRFLDAHWCAQHASGVLPHAHLLVSELVTNAVRHGAPPVTVALDCDPEGGVTLFVADGAETAPQLHRMTPDATSGRGVALVDELSAAWGVAPRDGDVRGKTVWCRLTV